MSSSPTPFPGGMPNGFPPFIKPTSSLPATDVAFTPPMGEKRNLAASIEREEDSSAAAQLDANRAENPPSS